MPTIPPALPVAFTLAQDRAAGLSKKRVYTLLERGQLALVSRGVYRRADSAAESEHEPPHGSPGPEIPEDAEI